MRVSDHSPQTTVSAEHKGTVLDHLTVSM
jgi:hydroxyacylglutathione hydrolase